MARNNKTSIPYTYIQYLLVKNKNFVYTFILHINKNIMRSSKQNKIIYQH